MVALAEVMPCPSGCGRLVAECDLCRAFVAWQRARRPGDATAFAILADAAAALRFAPVAGRS